MKFNVFAMGAAALAVTGAAAVAQAETAKPMFAVLPSKAPANLARLPGSSIPNYTYTWSYRSTKWSAQIVGTNPKNTNTTTTIPVYIFPVSMTCQGKTFSALDQDALYNNGKTVLDNTIGSPMFQTGVDFKSGGQDLGSTQYIDAYARGNFWGAKVKANTKWHMLLGNPQVQNLIKYSPSSCSIATEFGVQVIEDNINDFDNNVVAKYVTQVPTNALAIFVTTQTYLTSGGCCIGGYHTQANNGTTYAMFTYIQKAGAFSQNVSALSHEIGEWDLDPFTNNRDSCPAGGLLENGDPLEGLQNYGGYNYTLNGLAYTLQDLVYITYFGAPLKTSVGKQTTFQGENVPVCSRGQ